MVWPRELRNHLVPGRRDRVDIGIITRIALFITEGEILYIYISGNKSVNYRMCQIVSLFKTSCRITANSVYIKTDEGRNSNIAIKLRPFQESCDTAASETQRSLCVYLSSVISQPTHWSGCEVIHPRTMHQ